MSEKDQKTRRIQVPIALEEELGLGDVVKRFTNAMGFKTCGGCQQRANWLNQRVVFSGNRANLENKRPGYSDYPDE